MVSSSDFLPFSFFVEEDNEFCLVPVSVAGVVLRRQVASLPDNPPPFRYELETVTGGVALTFYQVKKNLFTCLIEMVKLYEKL